MTAENKGIIVDLDKNKNFATFYCRYGTESKMYCLAYFFT
jgi:hypothetical protein